MQNSSIAFAPHDIVPKTTQSAVFALVHLYNVLSVRNSHRPTLFQYIELMSSRSSYTNPNSFTHTQLDTNLSSIQILRYVVGNVFTLPGIISIGRYHLK